MMPCAWLKRAMEDLTVAKDELHNITWASAFHSQQAAEKALKALLIALGVEPPKSHRIEKLLELLEENGVDTSSIRESTILTDYAVETRYPDFDKEPTLEEAEEALRIAKKVVEWVRERLGEKGVEC